MPRKRVAMVIHAGVQALDVAGPLDVLTEANQFIAQDRGYDCVVVAKSTDVLQASNGMPMGAQQGYGACDAGFHTLLVAGGPGLPGQAADPDTSDWLRRASSAATRYGSICTGAFLLGHAGLLDGRTATTHWQHAGELAALFPRARVAPDRIYARDGPLVTSAGVTAGIDLALALVREDHGPAVAVACAKRLVVVAQRQGGQSQFSPLQTLAADPMSPLGKVQAYVMAHLGDPLPVERLAGIAGTSARSIARIFVSELGITPHAFVENLRIDRARNLLEATDLAVKAVAFECGFATPELMRTTFQRRLGVSPVRYRAHFQAGPSGLGRAAGDVQRGQRGAAQ